MARVRISKEAREMKPFVLMPEGEQIIQVTKVEVKPKRNPRKVSIEAKNKDGIVIKNSWDLKNDKQEPFFWLFFNTGCGCDEDDEGFVNPEDMLGRFASITVKHNVYEADEIEVDGEIKKRPARTFANFEYINENVSGFDGLDNDEELDLDDDDIELDEDEDDDLDLD